MAGNRSEPVGGSIEPSGRFTLLRLMFPGIFVTVHENLGLRGYGDLLRYLWAERMFDRKFGTITEYLVPSEALDFADHEAQAQASRYRATPPFCISTSLGRLSEMLGGLEKRVMVDYGSGAGRAMILAAEAGFARVIGLELSPPLVAQCRRNLESFAAGQGAATHFEVLETDATLYIPPPDASVFYFFNPFSPEFFELALDGIRKSLRRDPRPVYLLLFQAWRFRLPGLDLIADVTGVRTYTNALDPEKFLSVGP